MKPRLLSVLLQRFAGQLNRDATDTLALAQEVLSIRSMPDGRGGSITVQTAVAAIAASVMPSHRPTTTHEWASIRGISIHRRTCATPDWLDPRSLPTFQAPH